MKSNKSFALFLGILSAFFFAVTFVVNRLMSVEGGSWIWSSSLRFFWMVPLLFFIVITRKNIGGLFKEIMLTPLQWLLWSVIGFGLFYAPLTFAAAYGPSWLVASTWQVTIIAGMLISPFINKKSVKEVISFKILGFSLIILLGIVIMQISQARSISTKELISGTIPVLIAAFAYPLGNRKMMQLTNGKLDAFQRTLGMTLCSLPFWLILSIYGFYEIKLPEQTQVWQTLIVAISSGVIATTLFFMATDKVRKKEKLLASVEATQSAEVLFALLGEILILQTHLPDLFSTIGIIFVILGMILHSLKT